MDMFYEWTDIVRVKSVTDAFNSLSSCLGHYNHALQEMGCRYFEQMLVHCYEGECLKVCDSVIWDVNNRHKMYCQGQGHSPES
jgi:hypothetical protein